MADTAAGRTPPHNNEAEQAFLGSIFSKPESLGEMVGRVRSDDFYRPAHQTIYESMVDLMARGESVDHISVANDLKHNGRLDRAGGPSYLIELSTEYIPTGKAGTWAKLIRDAALKRKLIEAGTQIVAMGYEGDGAEEVIGESVNLVMGLGLANATRALPVGTVLNDLIKQLKLGPQDFLYPPLLPTIHIHPGELVVVGAGTSVGKTAVSVNWADEWSKRTKVVYYEYEMSEINLVQRIVARHSGITIAQMEEGLSDEQIKTVMYAASEIASRQLHVEAVTCDMTTLLAKIRRDAQMGAKVVFIDHLGLIPFTIPKGESHAKALGTQVTNKLKRTAMELGIVIVLLSQLNRNGQNKVGPHPYPTLQDLRDSGEIEQDADKVILLWREKGWDDDPEGCVKRREKLNLDPFDRTYNLMHLGVEKYRNGALFGKMVAFLGDTLDMKPIYDEPKPLIQPRVEVEPYTQEELVEG